MAYALVFWTEERQYSVVSCLKIHGDVAEGQVSNVDWEEGRKGGRKAVKTTAYPAKIINRILHNSFHRTF